MNKSKKIILCILIAFIAFGIIKFSVVIVNYASTPVSNNSLKNAKIHIFMIKDTSFSEATMKLRQMGLVKDNFLFCSLAVLKMSYRQVPAGEYKFSGSMTPSEMIDELMNGGNKGN